MCPNLRGVKRQTPLDCARGEQGKPFGKLRVNKAFPYPSTPGWGRTGAVCGVRG